MEPSRMKPAPASPPSPDHSGADDEEDEDDVTGDTEDEEYISSFNDINPLRAHQYAEGTEAETIRNAYADREDDAGGTIEASPAAPAKRTFMFSGHDHEDTDNFVISTMLAIRTAVLAGTSDFSKPEVQAGDYQTTRKHKISMAGDRKVEVKDYAPVVFALLRRKCGITIPSYLLSWSDHKLAKSKSAGKSDSMFISSSDKKYILKTLTKSEAHRLLKILQSYYEHIIANPDTFLSKFFGLHRMNRRGQPRVYFTIINNVFETTQPLSEIYDLKGSTVGRRASCDPPLPRRPSTTFNFDKLKKGLDKEAEKAAAAAAAEEPAPPAAEKKKVPVLKDLDFTRKLFVTHENRTKVINQLAVDSKFLAESKLMDYSLLVGIRKVDGLLDPASASTLKKESAPAFSSHEVLKSSSSTAVPPQANVPRMRHSFALPAAIGQRVPGLLFFLESTKATSLKPSSNSQGKKTRRKSINMGPATFATAAELNAIDEEEKAEDEQNGTNGNASTTAATHPASTSTTTAQEQQQSQQHQQLTRRVSQNEKHPKALPALANTSTTSIDDLNDSIVINKDVTNVNTDPTTTPAHNNTNNSNTTNNNQTNNTAAKASNHSDDKKTDDTNTKFSADDIPTFVISPDTETTPAPKKEEAPVIAVNGRVRADSSSSESTDADHSTTNSLGLTTQSSVMLAHKAKEAKDKASGLSSSTSSLSSTTASLTATSEISSSSLATSAGNNASSVPPINTHAATHAGSAGGAPVTAIRMAPGLSAVRKPSRSSSLNHITNLDVSSHVHLPFYRTEDGGMKGATSSLPTDPKYKHEVYYVGLIDFLQKYNAKKMLAGAFKSIKYEREELSTVDPSFYQDRFMKMVERSFSDTTV